LLMEQRYARIKSLILERGCELITRIDYFDETVNRASFVYAWYDVLVVSYAGNTVRRNSNTSNQI